MNFIKLFFYRFCHPMDTFNLLFTVPVCREQYEKEYLMYIGQESPWNRELTMQIIDTLKQGIRLNHMVEKMR